ncbi:MAG: class I SAM-dependent methyltransferase [Deltaproteobacteria bacterium]|nr:class I SAM-dependent methyltransferase [Deltaproteobacteria bacterium]
MDAITSWTGLWAWVAGRDFLSERRRRRDQALLYLLDRVAPPGGSAVDLGAGSGFLTLHLARSARRVIAVDASKDMLSQLDAAAVRLDVAPRIVTVLAPVDDTGLPSGEADLVCASGLLHEVPDPDAVLREAWRLLRPGGALVLQDFASRRWWGFSRFVHVRGAHGPMDAAEIGRRLAAVGFVVRTVKGDGSHWIAHATRPDSPADV